MTDDTYLRAIIPAMREQERAAAQERAQFDTWNDAQIAAIYDNPEAERIMRGDARTLSDAERAEVERLSRINTTD